ncbi:hypothetical protein N9X63_04190 [Woeseiaceae bacterium]|jgi:hypothetical protein|nr:hypothetical protein [Woeseiaceae bacterium]MDB2544251.1 hypothetical protein [Woeseiaceae bacterium]
MFEWLEYSILSIWVGESLWGYPIMLSFHVVGLAIVVGIFTVFNFRILGLFESIEYIAFVDFFKLAWFGLILNASSGFALFSSQATIFVTNTPFLVKISAISLGSILAFFIQSRLRVHAHDWDSQISKPSKKDFWFARTSLFLWVSAIFGGRLIAYYL